MVISKKPLQFILAMTMALMPIVNFANSTNDSTVVEAHAAPKTEEVAHEEGHGHAEPTDIKSQVKAFTKHHVLDSHDFTLYSDFKEGKHVGFPLPVILWDNGLHVFMSSAFHHGESVAESNGNYYALHHNKIYKTDASGSIQLDADHHALNAKPLDLSITKNVFMILVVSLLMLW